MTRRLRLAAEDGYTMAAVMLVMLATSMLAGATFAAVGGDIPFARAGQDRKQAYAAAEAGVEYYLYQLTRDNDFWKNCATVPQPSPINLAEPGSGRKWRTLSGTGGSRFSIELLPANNAAQCDPSQPELTLLDKSTGSFRIRSTGQSRGITRSIVTTFRRASFLEYLYFTDYEALDPLVFEDPDDRQYAATHCVKYRAARNLDSWCKNNVSITFPDWDNIKGPLHTNDDLLTCGSPEFGRDSNDRIEIGGPNPPGWQSDCSGAPVFKGVVRQPAPHLDVPASNSRLKDAALAGYVFYGETTIRFDGTMTMDVQTHTEAGAPITYTNKALPANGVIYVEKFGTCQLDQPVDADYVEDNGCAILTVSGTYPKSMTLGARDDILIDNHIQRSGDVVLGLIAQRFVRIKHPVSSDCDDNVSPTLTNLTIEAAMLALNDSFVLDNWGCGNPLGTLTVRGAIAQRFRGAVGQFSGSTKTHGYTKDYNYDDRLRYRSPPYFLDPISAAWRVVRNNEQVPAEK